MREFIRRALQKTSRMNGEQIQSLLTMITEEYEMLDAVLDSLGTGLLICDAYHVVVQNNKAATRILPMDYHDYQERPVWACIHDPEISAFVEETIEKRNGHRTGISRTMSILRRSSASVSCRSLKASRYAELSS